MVPTLETSFSMMDDIINQKSEKMNIETKGAIQTMKHVLVGVQAKVYQILCKCDSIPCKKCNVIS